MNGLIGIFLLFPQGIIFRSFGNVVGRYGMGYLLTAPIYLFYLLFLWLGAFLDVEGRRDLARGRRWSYLLISLTVAFSIFEEHSFLFVFHSRGNVGNCVGRTIERERERAQRRGIRNKKAKQSKAPSLGCSYVLLSIPRHSAEAVFPLVHH